MDQPLPLAVAQEESNPHQEREELVCNTPQIRIMTEQLPLTDLYFATENESNIVTIMAQESSPHQESAQLVFSTFHRPRQRMEDGVTVCTALGERGRVLLENVLPLPVQATTHHRGHHDDLVCPPLSSNGGGVEIWLHHAEIVCGSVLTSPLSYEEGSEVVCGEVGWRRTTQTHQTSNTTEPSSVVWHNLEAMNTQPHTTHHYIPQLLSTPNTPVAAGAYTDFSYECHSLEEEEYQTRSGIPREAVGDPPSTQQLVTGRMT